MGAISFKLIVLLAVILAFMAWLNNAGGRSIKLQQTGHALKGNSLHARSTNRTANLSKKEELFTSKYVPKFSKNFVASSKPPSKSHRRGHRFTKRNPKKIAFGKQKVRFHMNSVGTTPRTRSEKTIKNRFIATVKEAAVHAKLYIISRAKTPPNSNNSFGGNLDNKKVKKGIKISTKRPIPKALRKSVASPTNMFLPYVKIKLRSLNKTDKMVDPHQHRWFGEVAAKNKSEDPPVSLKIARTFSRKATKLRLKPTFLNVRGYATFTDLFTSKIRTLRSQKKPIRGGNFVIKMLTNPITIRKISEDKLQSKEGFNNKVPEGSKANSVKNKKTQTSVAMIDLKNNITAKKFTKKSRILRTPKSTRFALAKAKMSVVDEGAALSKIKPTLKIFTTTPRSFSEIMSSTFSEKFGSVGGSGGRSTEMQSVKMASAVTRKRMRRIRRITRRVVHQSLRFHRFERKLTRTTELNSDGSEEAALSNETFPVLDVSDGLNSSDVPAVTKPTTSTTTTETLELSTLRVGLAEVTQDYNLLTTGAAIIRRIRGTARRLVKIKLNGSRGNRSRLKLVKTETLHPAFDRIEVDLSNTLINRIISFDGETSPLLNYPENEADAVVTHGVRNVANFDFAHVEKHWGDSGVGQDRLVMLGTMAFLSVLLAFVAALVCCVAFS